jgi:hypothetical protein
MPKAITALTAALLLLVGCASTISGQPSAVLGVAGPATSSTTTSSSDPSSSSSSSRASSSSSRSTTSTTAPTSSTSPKTSSSSTSDSVEIPDGFSDFGDGLAYRGLDPDEIICTADQTGCFGVEIFSVAGCAAGAAVVLDLYNDDVDPATVIGQGSGTTPAIDAGGIQRVIIGDTTGYDGRVTAGINDISC